MKNTTTLQERNNKQENRNKKIHSNRVRVLNLKEKGMTNVEIAKYIGISESSVRSLLYLNNQNQIIVSSIVNLLKATINKKGYVNVSVGIETLLGVSKTKLKQAITKLENDGYKLHYIWVDLFSIGKNTTLMILAKSDTTYEEVCSLYEKYGL